MEVKAWLLVVIVFRLIYNLVISCYWIMFMSVWMGGIPFANWLFVCEYFEVYGLATNYGVF